MSVLYGKYPASLILDDVKIFTESVNKKPCFAIIKVGNNQASNTYVNFKQIQAKKVGIDSQLFCFDENVKFDYLKSIIEDLNSNDCINGVIVQLPLPHHLVNIIRFINPDKDIDGLTLIQQGNLLLNNDGLFPCTALGVVELLKYYNVPLVSKKVAVIGRSNLVGKPLALMLLNENSLVSIFHSKIDFELLQKELSSYDIICSAVGKKHFIKKDFIKKGSVLIDIGVSKDCFGTFGDFDIGCYEKANSWTPNIGGVGPMTIACLLRNIIKAYSFQNEIIF